MIIIIKINPLLNKITQASSAYFCDTRSVYCIVPPPHKEGAVEGKRGQMYGDRRCSDFGWLGTKNSWRTMRKECQFWELSENFPVTYSGEIKKTKLVECVTQLLERHRGNCETRFIIVLCPHPSNVTRDDSVWNTEVLTTVSKGNGNKKPVEKFWNYLTNLINLYFHF